MGWASGVMGNPKPPLIKLQPVLSLCACFIPYKEESTHLRLGIDSYSYLFVSFKQVLLCASVLLIISMK